METKRILVTGGAGFMGRWVCKTLVDKGHDIYCIDDLSGGSLENIVEFKDKLANFYQVDLADSNAKEIIEYIKPEIIFHLAANAREGASFFQPLEIVKRNLLGYTNVLESGIRCGKLDKVILFSSMAVYGYGIENKKTGIYSEGPFYEWMPRSPVDIYGINKAAMEHSTEILSKVHGFRYTILRPHNVMGPYQCYNDKYRNVVMIMTNKIMRKEPITVYGDGRQKRAFSFIEDSLECYINAMDEKCDNEIINIGGSVPITINTLVELVCKGMGMGIEDESYPIEHLEDRFGEVKVAYCSTEKSRELLGYEEKIGYEEGIRRTVLWAKSRGPSVWKEDKLELWNDKAPGWWK